MLPFASVFLHAMALVLLLRQCNRLPSQHSAGTVYLFYYHIPESCSTASVVRFGSHVCSMAKNVRLYMPANYSLHLLQRAAINRAVETNHRVYPIAVQSATPIL